MFSYLETFLFYSCCLLAFTALIAGLPPPSISEYITIIYVHFYLKKEFYPQWTSCYIGFQAGKRHNREVIWFKGILSRESLTLLVHRLFCKYFPQILGNEQACSPCQLIMRTWKADPVLECTRHHVLYKQRKVCSRLLSADRIMCVFKPKGYNIVNTVHHVGDSVGLAQNGLNCWASWPHSPPSLPPFCWSSQLTPFRGVTHTHAV